MSQTESILEPALRDLADALDDFARASFQNADSLLRRFIYVLVLSRSPASSMPCYRQLPSMNGGHKRKPQAARWWARDRFTGPRIAPSE